MGVQMLVCLSIAPLSLLFHGMAALSVLGAALSAGSRLMRGSGELLRIPTIDIAEVGAGGGSIAWLDPAGGLQVGPRSAGASPGGGVHGVCGRNAARAALAADGVTGWPRRRINRAVSRLLTG